MNRREFIKGVLAITAVASLPAVAVAQVESTLTACLPYNVPIGYIFSVVDDCGKAIYILGTDKGPKILEGGYLTKKDFPELFNFIGQKYGGNKQEFRLPDLRTKFNKEN